MMEFNLLEKKDFENYLKLMNQFRPINFDMNYELFCKLYDKIFLSGEIYVACLDNKIVGSIKVFYEQKFINNCALYAHIEDVIVDENYRHLKIGSQLLDHVKKKALESLGISLKKRGIKVEMSEIKFIEETIKSFYENKS